MPKFTSDAMDVITDPDVDAVWMSCSPSQYHADQIKACAANGKHVFCEKPIATNLAETVEAINACNEAGVKLMIGLQRRFDPNFLRVRKAIEDKEVGETIIVSTSLGRARSDCLPSRSFARMPERRLSSPSSSFGIPRFRHEQIKTCSRDPAPPPYEYVKGGGGIFNDMAVHDLDMTRFLAGDDPVEILAVGSCHIDKSIEDLPGSEAFDTATCIVRYPRGVNAMVDVCRQSSYGYDQRAEVLGTSGMIATDNVYPNTAKIYKNDFTGNADMPFDFFLSRYFEAYVTETEAFCKSLVEDSPVPCTGIDGLIALVMSLAADKSAAEGRWVKFSEVIEQVYCSSPTECLLLVDSDVFPDGFKPTKSIKELDNLVVPDVDQQKKGGTFMDKFKEMVWS